MPVTVGTLTAFFTGSGNKPAITAADITRFLVWADSEKGSPGAALDDLADLLYAYMTERTSALELGTAQDQVPQPAPFG